MIKTPPVDQDLLIACSSSSICTRQTTNNEQKRGRKRKHAPSFPLWVATSPEVRFDALRFLDARNIQRLKLVNRNVVEFVEYHDEHWPVNGFSMMRLTDMGNYKTTRYWNTAITMHVQPNMENCPTKYIDKLALLVDLQPFIQELPQDGLTLFRDYAVDNWRLLFHGNPAVVFERPAIRLYLELPKTITTNNLHWLCAWLLCLAYEWKATNCTKWVGRMGEDAVAFLHRIVLASNDAQWMAFYHRFFKDDEDH